MRLFFTLPSPRILATTVVLFVCGRPWVGPWSMTDLWVILGVALYWPFQEWFLHQHLLHFKPKKFLGFTIDPIAGRYHRFHHRHPWRIETSTLPFAAVLVLTPTHWTLWWLFTPSLSLACTGIAAFTFAALVYEWVHYLTHTPYRPRSAYYKRIWRNHRLHHFKHEDYWHSFTVPYIDIWFRTAPNPKDVPTSDTCMTLGVDE
ncbi:MAG: sterol desaturase family protein [Myxococcota bacterium]|nr:sterol desaturase family protein [Myxococcota bacterium]